MGNELLVHFTTLLLDVERILTLIFVGLAKFYMGKKVKNANTNWETSGLQLSASLLEGCFAARRLLPLKLNIPSMPLFPYPIEGYSKYRLSKIALFCVY